MFYTEGFCSEDTYEIEGRIYTIAVETLGIQGVCWCVLTHVLEEKVKDIEQALKCWFYQLCAFETEKGKVYIQRELNRFGAFLMADASSYGLKKCLQLYVVMNHDTYFFAEEGYQEYGGIVYGGWERISDTLLYLSAELRHNKKFQKLIENYTKKPYGRMQFANQLEKVMLEEHGFGRIACGYFLMWGK